jgi:S1-C subfamily serine protease
VPVGGDVIVAVAGQPVERADDVARIVTDSLEPGQVVDVTVLRGGKGERRTVEVRLVERPVDP